MMRDLTTPNLNPTLSMTSNNDKVEVIKSILFQDPFESREKFKIISNDKVEVIKSILFQDPFESREKFKIISNNVQGELESKSHMFNV